MLLRARSGAALVALVAAACGGDAPVERQPAVVRDSAGITIVENDATAWAPGQEWSLSPEPVALIGVEEGPEEYQLFRANDAVRLPSGDILVVNGGTYELRFYDSTGTYLHAVGREGAGPGEFKSIGQVHRYRGDSLMLFDWGNSRIAVLGPRGEFGRVFSMDAPPNASPASLLGPFADGTLLARSYPLGDMGMEPGFRRSTHVYGRYDAEGALIDTLVGRPGYEMYTGTAGGRQISGSPPFGRMGIDEVGPDRWYYGTQDAFEIEEYAPDGRLVRLIRRALPNRPITSEIADEYVRRALEGESRLPDAMRRWRAEIPLPETMPAYRGFLVDDLGNLWVREYSWGTEPVSWVVFDAEGRFLGPVAMPTDDGRPTHIGADFVLGTWNTEMEVEQVRMYRLRKPPVD